LVEGCGEDFIPPICDLSRVKHAYSIPDEESLLTARTLLRNEGILAGSSSGLLLAGALRYCREQTSPKRVVTFACDTGGKYLSKMFNDFWMHDQGFLRGPNVGDLRDVIGRSHEQGSTVGVGPEDTLLVAYSRMKLYDVSQLVVFEHNRVIGIIDEHDLLLAVHGNEEQFRRHVRDFMTARLFTCPPSTDLEALMPLLQSGLTVIVSEGDKFYGLITRIDVLNYLRRKLR
jgi:cystathionine beta-synthase